MKSTVGHVNTHYGITKKTCLTYMHNLVFEVLPSVFPLSEDTPRIYIHIDLVHLDVGCLTIGSILCMVRRGERLLRRHLGEVTKPIENRPQITSAVVKMVLV